MRSFMVVLAVFCLSLVTAVYSQNTQPPGGQPQRPAAGQAPGGFSNNPANTAPGGADQATFRQQVSYALGRNFATNLRDNEIEIDANALVAGISDALRGAQPKWSEQQLEATLQRFGQEMQQKGAARMQQQAAKNQQEANNFLIQNGKKAGVQTTPSGLQYRVLQQGNGASPTLADTVKCNYRGTLINGTEFDSSSRHGGAAEFGVGEVIKGWTEALQKMHVGDKWQLFVPSKLAYDMNPPRAPIEAGSMLVFEIELLDIVKK